MRCMAYTRGGATLFWGIMGQFRGHFLRGAGLIGGDLCPYLEARAEIRRKSGGNSRKKEKTNKC